MQTINNFLLYVKDKKQAPSVRASLNSRPQRSHLVIPVDISHDTTFAPHDSASETSSAVYILRAEHPGVVGRGGYSWDKRFLKDLEENRDEQAGSAPLIWETALRRRRVR